MYNNSRSLDHLEATRCRFRKIEAVLKVSSDYNVLGIKRCGIKIVYRIYNTFWRSGPFRGRLRILEAVFESSLTMKCVLAT